MGRGGTVLVLVIATTAIAHAEPSVLVANATATATAPSLLASVSDPELLERRWPALPSDHRESEDDVMIDHLSALGNTLGNHMTLLSDQMIGLHVDGRGQRAQLRVGTGNGHFLSFKLDSDWFFSDGKARINAHVQLRLASHQLDVQLPAMEMEPTSYHGDDGVMLKLPLFERRW
jgi:hypothetical protein